MLMWTESRAAATHASCFYAPSTQHPLGPQGLCSRTNPAGGRAASGNACPGAGLGLAASWLPPPLPRQPASHVLQAHPIPLGLREQGRESQQVLLDWALGPEGLLPEDHRSAVRSQVWGHWVTR